MGSTKGTIYYQLNFSIFETCVIPIFFQALADVLCFSNLSWANYKGAAVMLWYAVQRFRISFFSSPFSQALLTWRGRCVHGPGSREAGIVGVVRARLRWRPAPGSEGTEGADWTAEPVAVEHVANPCCVSRRRSDGSTCGTHQLAGRFKTFDSWPASVMAISFGTSIEKIQ